MTHEFRLDLPGVEEESMDKDCAAWLDNYLASVEECIRSHDRWKVVTEVALGAFNFQKLAMCSAESEILATDLDCRLGRDWPGHQTLSAIS
jgi:hypothetical protein